MEELNVFDKLTAIATPAQLTMFGDSERSRAIAEHKAYTPIPSAFSLRTYLSASTVFLAKRATDFVMI